MSSLLTERTFPSPQDLCITSLFNLMGPEFRESIVACVLSQRGQLPSDVNTALDGAINEDVRIPQFPRYPAKAPPPILKQAVLRDLSESNSLASAVLSAWFTSQPTLRDLVSEHLRTRSVDVEHLDFGTHRLNGYWSSDRWTAECERILESHHDLDIDEVAMMVCCVTSKMPSADAKALGEEKFTMEHDILGRALSYLEGLPADSPEWEANVHEFLTSVNDLVDAKKDERESVASREALTTAVSEFLEVYSGQMQYLELDASGWTMPSDCHASVVSEAQDLLKELSRLIDEYDSIPQRGTSLTETRSLIEEQQKVENRIRNVKSALDGLLVDGKGPDDPTTRLSSHTDSHSECVDADPEVEPPAASTDATLSELQLSTQTLDFDPTTLNYPVTLDNSVNRLTIRPVASHSGAKVKVSVGSMDGDAGGNVESDIGVYSVENIPVGQTHILVNVTAEDKKTSQSYVLAVTRPASSDATLITLALSAEDLAFNPDATEYNVELADGINELSIAFETAHDAATVEATIEPRDGATVSEIELEGGRCDISGLINGRTILALTVTAEDGVTTRTYSVSLNRKSHQGTDNVALMWSLVAQDDLAGAYWISKSLVARNQVPSQLPILLKAAQGARWLSPDSKDFVEELFMAVSETAPPFEDDAHALLGLAAAVQPCIIAPEANLLAWLNSPVCLPSLEGIVLPVQSFANWGHALLPEHIRGDEGNRHLHDLITEASSDAGRWLKDSDKRFHNLVRANNVWRQLCTKGGMLNNLLKTVAADNRQQVSSVRSDVDALNQDSYRNEVITEADQSLLGAIPKAEIAGAARGWLQRGIGEACHLAEQWCDLVERYNKTREQAQNLWLSNQVSELRTQIESASQDVLGELSRIASDSDRIDLSGSAICLSRSIQRLLDYLSVEHGANLTSEVPAVVSDMQTTIHGDGHSTDRLGSMDRLEAALARRLLWIPAIDLDDDGLPLDPEAPVDLDLVEADWFDSDTPLQAVVQSRIERSDFRFFDLLCKAFSPDMNGELRVAYSTYLTAAREALDDHLNTTRASVEQAANDGVIEYEGAEWNKFEYALDAIVVDEVLNFRGVHDTLDEIQTSVGEERTRRREELIADWEEMYRDEGGDSDRELDFLQGLTATFETARRQESLDIRVMEDCVSRMRHYLSGDRDDIVLVRSEEFRKTLEEFLSFCRGMGNSQAHVGGGNGLRNLMRRSRGEM